MVLLKSLHDRLVGAEALADLLRGPAESLKENGDGLLALAVDANADEVLLVDLELKPGATTGDDLGDEDILVCRLVRRALEVDARRTHELRHHDALRAVDDEGALLGHQRELAHEDRLRLDLAGLVVHELRGDEQRGGVSEVLLHALIGGVLRGLEPMVAEGQRHGPREILNGADLLEDLLQAGRRRDILAAPCDRGVHAGAPGVIAQEPVEAGRLQGQKVWHCQGLADLRERRAVELGGQSSGARGGQEGSFHVCRDARHRRCQTGWKQRKAAAYPLGTPLSTPGGCQRQPSSVPSPLIGYADQRSPGRQAPGGGRDPRLGIGITRPQKWCAGRSWLPKAAESSDEAGL